MKNRIEIKKLSYHINKKPILKEINLSLEEGKFYGILGPNGSGKTTFLDLILGLVQKTDGEILINNIGLDSFKRQQLAQMIALVPQNFDILFPYKVQDILEMGRYPYKKRLKGLTLDDYQIVEEVKKSFDLYQLEDKCVTNLSGGEKQRVAFSKALIQKTPILFLDESTSNMDPYYAHFALNEVKKVTSVDNKIVVGVFHDMNLAAHYCDEIILFKDGYVLNKGLTIDVLTPENIKKLFNIESDAVVKNGKQYIIPAKDS